MEREGRGGGENIERQGKKERGRGREEMGRRKGGKRKRKTN